MNANDLDAIEDSLGIVLPASYAKMIRRLGRKQSHDTLAELICTDGEALLSLNERVAEFQMIAGLPEWPDELFVIGEDGVGNYYAIRHEEEDSAVFFFDHERDEIRQCAESLDDFCKRIKTLAALDEKVVHRASRRARVLDHSGVIPDLVTQPSWTRDWKDFTKVFAAIVNDKPAAPRGAATVKRLNQTFGSRAVCWTGRVVEIEFGKQPYVEIDMPPTLESKTERFEGLGNLVLFLRLGRSPGVCMSEAGTPQVVTTRDAWRDVHPGYRIQFLMMIAPGHGHDISCIDAKAMALHDCGAHVLKIIDRGSLTKPGRRRQARASRSRSPSRT